MLGLGIGLPRLMFARGAALSPTAQIRNQLFSGGANGVLFYPKPMVDGEQVLWEMSDGTVAVDTHDDPVGRMDDLSSNDNHATQSTASNKMLYKTDGMLHWLSSDGVDDSITCAGFATAKTIMVALRREDLGGLVVLSPPGDTPNLFTIQDGGAGTPYGGLSVLEVLVDGSVTSTRGAMHNATSDLSWHILEARQADISGWSNIKIGDYTNSAFKDPFRFGGMLVFDSDDAEDRDAARQYLADLVGVTL